MLTEDRSNAKRRLRSEIARSLRATSAAEALASGRRAGQRLRSWRGYEAVSELVLFSSLPGEVSTVPFVEAARARGLGVLLPRMVGRDLEFVSFEPKEPLVAGRFGVLEPSVVRPARTLRDGAVVLVPGIAFDLRGGRLGRGAGYYDRALARLRSESVGLVFIGLGFPLQIVERVPMTEHDVPVDAVLTEDALIWVGPADAAAPD